MLTREVLVKASAVEVYECQWSFNKRSDLRVYVVDGKRYREHSHSCPRISKASLKSHCWKLTHTTSLLPQSGQGAWETAMGMRGFAGSAASKES